MSWLAISVLGLTVGCDPGTESAEENAGGAVAPVRASVTLRVAVVSDDALTRAIERLRGEWNTLTDGQIEAIPTRLDADLATAAKDVDLIVFPSRRLGELCESRALRPLRAGVLKSEALRFEDFLPLVRDQEVVYATEPMALPLGAPTPLLLAPVGAEATGFRLPSDNARLALGFLAWTAPHAVHRSRVATLFNSDDFAPRLTAPPFVRGLESFVAASGEGSSRLVWPDRRSTVESDQRMAARTLPGASEAYNTLTDAWESTREGDRRATLVASSGRLIAVTAASRNAATAFRYAAWLAGPDNARQVSAASDHVANCRGSFARVGDRWFDSADRELAKTFAEANAQALRTGRFLIAPRLPGADEYLVALGEQVREAVNGRPAEQALAAAAAAWEAISDARGHADQAAAYKRSVNMARFPASVR